jgi:hypothetical protein
VVFGCGVSMRNIFVPVLALPLIVALSSAALAEAPMAVACKALAAAVADDYMSDQIERVSDSKPASEGYSVAHVFGRKYLISASHGVLRPRGIGAATREWGQVYREERRRCLRTRLLNDFTLGN